MASPLAAATPSFVEHERYRRTLDALPQGFQIIAFDWTYLYVNHIAASHGRSSPGELIGRRMRDVYPGIEDTPMFAVLRQCMTERTAHVFENLFTFPDGSHRWFEVRVEPVSEGICVYSLEIHERKERQLALERRNAELERQLSSRSRFWAWLGPRA